MRRWIPALALLLVLIFGVLFAMERSGIRGRLEPAKTQARAPVPPAPDTPSAPRHYPRGRRPLAIANHDYPASFFPNTELLAAGEMRVTALGSGNTEAGPGQKSAGWLVELGNGDLFLFDAGTGSQQNLTALRPDWSKLDKVLLSHLHLDHAGDLDALWIGGWLAGRYTPLHVYGPSGEAPELGVAAFARNLRAVYAWDLRGRSGRLPESGGRLVAHEFDYGSVQVIYQRNGVTITQFPQIHALDGAVGFRLDWSGLRFVYGGDSAPSRWFLEQATGADIAIHECVPRPKAPGGLDDAPLDGASGDELAARTLPEGFGKLMAAARPRLAVAYHAGSDHETHRAQVEAIREHYAGPLTVAEDLMVWNLTPEHIEVRRAVVDTHPQPPGVTRGYAEAPRGARFEISEAMRRGAWDGYAAPEAPPE